MTGINQKIFEQAIEWSESNNQEFDFVAQHDGKKLAIKVNADFPDVPLYTLSIDNNNLDFDNWPNSWDR